MSIDVIEVLLPRPIQIIEVGMVGPQGPSGSFLPPGAVFQWQFRNALDDPAYNRLVSTAVLIPGEVDDPLNIAWNSKPYVIADDPIWTFVKDTYGYSTTVMDAIMELAKTFRDYN